MGRKPTITSRDLAAMDRGRVSTRYGSDGPARLVDKGKGSRARACRPPKTGQETHLTSHSLDQ